MMKKFKIVLMGILTLMLSLFCFVACGSVAGTYKFKSMTSNAMGFTVTYNAGDEIEGLGVIDEDYMVLELKDDGTAVALENGEADEEMSAMTWEEGEDGKIIFKLADVEFMTATVDGGTMTISQNTAGVSVTIVLEK